MSVSGILLLLVPNLIRGMLDVGLKSWVPTMIMENYGVSSSFAGAITTVLLVVNLLAIFLVAWMYPRRCRNAAVAVGIYFAVSVPLIAVLFWIGQIPLAVSLLFAYKCFSVKNTCFFMGNSISYSYSKSNTLKKPSISGKSSEICAESE